MNLEESISHLERSVAKLEKHVANQDAEMYQMAKQIDALKKDVARLNGSIEGIADGATSPKERDLKEEKPPHY